MEPVSSCALMVSALYCYSVVGSVVLSEDFEVMRWILNSSSRGLYLSTEAYGFKVTKDSDKLTTPKEYTELSLVEL